MKMFPRNKFYNSMWKGKNSIFELNKREIGLQHQFRKQIIENSDIYNSDGYNSNLIELENIIDTVTNRRPLENPNPRNEYFLELTFKRDGRYLLINQNQTTLILFDWNSQRISHTISLNRNKFCSSASILNFPSSSTIAYVEASNKICIMDLARGKRSRQVLYHNPNGCHNLAEHPTNPNIFMTTNASNKVVRHDVRDRVRSRPILNCRRFAISNLRHFCVHPIDSNIFSVGDQFGNIGMFDERVLNQPIIREYTGDKAGLYNISYNYDGTELLANHFVGAHFYPTNFDQNIAQWSSNNNIDTESLYRYLYMGAKSEVILGVGDNIQVWFRPNFNSLSLTKSLYCSSLAVHPSYEYFCTGDQMGFVKIWCSKLSSYYHYQF